MRVGDVNNHTAAATNHVECLPVLLASACVAREPEPHEVAYGDDVMDSDSALSVAVQP